MTIEFEETIREERLEQGKRLQERLNELDTEDKNAIIGYRTVNKEIPQEVDNEDLEYIDFKSSIDTLAMMGLCYVDEEDMSELLSSFRRDVGDIYSDHRAWSMLTVLEVDAHTNPDESYYEGNIYSNGSKVNDVPIDLICESSSLELITCKFNISNQNEEAVERAKMLSEILEGLDRDYKICLGTLSPKIKQRIEAEVGDTFDNIISGLDMLDFA